MNKVLLLAGAMIAGTFSANAQCTDWVQPAPPAAYNDFDPAPCTGTELLVEVGIPSAIAFTLGNAIVGAEYSFDICSGPTAGAWVADFTIIAPSGAVDAFGAGDGDGCTITWTATEAGAYTLVVNEEGQCGVQNATATGYPRVTTISGGADCPEPPVFVEGAESFEGGALPECWMTMDEDGDGFDWNVFDGVPGFDGLASMRSESYENDTPAALTPDNYLITPKLDLGAGDDSLYYVVAALDANFPAENYSVLVSTTGTAIADFTDEVFTEVLATDVWEGRSIDMSAYANQSIYIAFRHHNVTDQFAFMIDAVALPGTVDCTTDGVFNADKLENITVYPNPSNGVFNVMNSGVADTYQIRVFDITGKQVVEEQVVLTNGGQYTIDLASAAKGVYTVQFVSPSNTGALRIVKN